PRVSLATFTASEKVLLESAPVGGVKRAIGLACLDKAFGKAGHEGFADAESSPHDKSAYNDDDADDEIFHWFGVLVGGNHSVALPSGRSAAGAATNVYASSCLRERFYTEHHRYLESTCVHRIGYRTVRDRIRRDERERATIASAGDR
ncbi:MAG: hypothetical protein JOZ50_09180, partial [Candidatus Eremiobacteraeota bacterium]|nr:hypothetical protein [Candidatus Eremiobacteraeota bacterium]